MENLVHHVHPYNLSTLQQQEVEEFSYELPRVIHFTWMIAWGLDILMGVKVPNIFHLSCLKKAST